MRLLYTLFTLCVGGYALFWFAEKNPSLKEKADELLNFRTTDALQMRYGADQIMEAYQKTLLKPRGSRYLTPELKFYPYLLLEVKYLDQNKTKEGLVLWDLTDGEMVIDTKTWKKTHGFADCILNNIQGYEFKILTVLANKGGYLDQSVLENKIDIEPPVLEAALRTCLRKNLIFSTGNGKYRLHLENPNFVSIPETKLYEQLTTTSHKRCERVPHQFSAAKVKRMVRMAFGEHCSVRKSLEVFLPVHRIIVQSPDDSMHTFHFNALTGKKLPAASFYQ